MRTKQLGPEIISTWVGTKLGYLRYAKLKFSIRTRASGPARQGRIEFFASCFFFFFQMLIK